MFRSYTRGGPGFLHLKTLALGVEGLALPEAPASDLCVLPGSLPQPNSLYHSPSGGRLWWAVKVECKPAAWREPQGRKARLPPRHGPSQLLSSPQSCAGTCGVLTGAGWTMLRFRSPVLEITSPPRSEETEAQRAVLTQPRCLLVSTP